MFQIETVSVYHYGTSMRTPLTYYGGKQGLAKWIISHFPPNYQNLHYIEAFAGGLAIFFEKEPSQAETINDLDYNIYNLFKELRDNGEELFRLLDLTLFNENDFKEARKLTQDKNISNTKKAYYDYVLYQMAFGKVYGGPGGNSGFGFCKLKKHEKGRGKFTGLNHKAFHKKIKERIGPAIDRLKSVQIMNRSANEMVDKFDSPLSLFYLDPPYPETDQGYVKAGYSIKDFNELTKKLNKIKGKFLLSFYKKEGMNLYDFNIYNKNTIVRVRQEDLENLKRVECLATNF